MIILIIKFRNKNFHETRPLQKFKTAPFLTNKGGSKPIYCYDIVGFTLTLKGEHKWDQFLNLWGYETVP